MASNRWRRESEILVLSYLNLNIDAFRNEDTRQESIQAAAGHLTEKMEIAYDAGHVSKKLGRLWNTYGPLESETINILYEQGVTFHTLPRMRGDKDKAGLLEEVGARAKADNSQTQKTGRALRKDWEIKHCCPFDHDDGDLVQCDGEGCVVWQHRRCCYPNTDVAIIRATEHYCQDCIAKQSQGSHNTDMGEHQAVELPIRVIERTNSRAKAETGRQIQGNSVTRNFDHLSLEDQNTELRALASLLQQERNDIAVKYSIQNTRLCVIEDVLIDHHRLGQFTTFGRASSQDEAAQSLESHVLHKVIESLRSQSLRITLAILYRYRGATFFSNEECSEKLRDLCPEVEESQIKAAVQGVGADSNKENLLAAIIVLLVKRLVFDTRQPRGGLSDILLDEYQHCVFQRDGAGALQRLHLGAWSRFYQNHDGTFTKYINAHADTLSSQLVEALAIFLETGSQTEDIPPAEQPQNASKSLHGVLVPVIKDCLKLKTKATLSSEYYELQYLPSGTKYDPKRMRASPAVASSASKKGKTLFCLLPSVIKYKTKRFKDETLSAQDIGSLGEFINRKEGQRTDGTVLFSALVTLQ
ncbi:uncharacterized protein PAC_12614 [Phialocephala subalpina]|uniref:Zinc finger PHD-type domain-containing protein n=1 Tax=Phialocephala subalpina TaxID=576137 RepID=A0A1L7XCM7_9HELO|nr:uncharacterized protein PAC_12614 [Phialocephala subalpina]